MKPKTLKDVLEGNSSKGYKGLTLDKLMVEIGASATLYFYPNNIYLHFLRSKSDRVSADELEKDHYFGGKYYNLVKTEEYTKDNLSFVKLAFKEVTY